ncbi:transposase [Streptomyces sp. NPDC017991]|uniref:transposase n=1 Tax=Streptomyces sp. NPDC017991 TaxID=3365026 RepID=UPI003791589D
MGSGRWGWIVPDGLWELARPLLPPARVRPQGGGVANIDDEAVFAAIIYGLVSGCAWRALPPCFGASKSTVHRRSQSRGPHGTGRPGPARPGAGEPSGAVGPRPRRETRW